MPLCESCQNFDIHTFSTDPDGIRAYKLETANKAAREGCDFCTLLLISLKNDVALFSDAEADYCWIQMSLYDNFQSMTRNGKGYRYNKLIIKLAKRSIPKPAVRMITNDNETRINDGGKQYEFSIAADPGNPAARSNDVAGRYWGDDPASELHFLAIQRWLNECSAHPQCNQTLSGTTPLKEGEAPLPTRCIEIGHHGLILRETKGQCGSYITLSHRWDADTETCKTTMENYESRKRGLDSSTLSKTFQHAIVITQRLGIRFLWIDSICIIQSGDEGIDWGREAVQMAQYYQQSLMTIAAIVNSPELGLLSPRLQKPFTHLVQLPYRDMVGAQKGHFYLYKRKEPVDDHFQSAVSKSVLLTRGWVFQEWILSRRVVYFTPSQIFFECRTDGPKNECQEAINTRILNPTQISSTAFKAVLQFKNLSSNDEWYRAVESYSGLQLTMPDKDRIVALSGVAKEFREMLIVNDSKAQEQKPLEYISGLWLRDIHHGLLWEQKSTSKRCLKICGLPSWSWASLLLEVKWPERNQKFRNAFTVISLISEKGVVHSVNESDRQYLPFSGLPCTLSLNSTVNTEHYDVDNTFASLLIHGRLQVLLIKGYFQTSQDIQQAEEATGVKHVYHSVTEWSAAGLRNKISDNSKTESDDPDLSRPWRAICSPSLPEIVVGWGSFEQPDLQDQLNLSSNMFTYALHVSTESVSGGLGFGYFSFHHDVCNVLFLKNVGGRRFQRMGVGKLFDKDILKEFMSTREQKIELV